MNKIWNWVNFSVLAGVFFFAGISTVTAQGDPCADTAGQDSLSNKIRENYTKTDLPTVRILAESSRQYVGKYGSCTTDSIKAFNEWLAPLLEKWEKRLVVADKAAKQKILTDKFDAGLTAKNWDDVYAAGKALIDQWPDEFRPAEIVLGSIGLDETANKNPPVTKWNDETLKYARMSLADLESGKPFTTYGVSQFKYNNKEHAMAWMNYTIGHILAVDQKNKTEGVRYLYKATQLAQDTGANPAIYDVIGSYYYEDLEKQLPVVQQMIDAQKSDDTEDVKKQKLADIKTAVAQLNGTAERTFDAYARAYKYAVDTGYKDRTYKRLQDIYKVRFQKTDGLDAYIGSQTAKPFPDPATPIAPVFDPEPATAATTSATAAPIPAAAKPPVTTKTAKPGARSPSNP